MAQASVRIQPRENRSFWLHISPRLRDDIAGYLFVTLWLLSLLTCRLVHHLLTHSHIHEQSSSECRMLIVFYIAQQRFVRGIVISGVKG